MNKLLRVPISVLISIAVVVIITIITTLIVLFYQVEDSYHVTVGVQNRNGTGIMVDSHLLYKFKHGKPLTIQILGEHYTGTIGKIEQVSGKDLFNLNIIWSNPQHMPPLQSGSILDAVIVRGKHSIFDALFHSSV